MYILEGLLLICCLIQILCQGHWLSFKDNHVLTADMLRGNCLSVCHMEKLTYRIQDVDTPLPSQTHLYLQILYIIFHLPSCPNLFVYGNFLIYTLFFLFFSVAQPSASHPHLLPSLSLSHSLPSILHSLRQTIKQVFPWLTCNSPLPPHHPKPQTVGELQPEIQWGAEWPSILGQNLGPSGLLVPVAGLLCSAQHCWWGQTDSRHAHTTQITVPSKEIPMGSEGIKSEECWNGGKRKFCFTERALQLHTGQSDSSHMCMFLRKK